jgi:MYXO-CTERM domain-containing protein
MKNALRNVAWSRCGGRPLALVLVALASCTAEPLDDVGAETEAIVDGTAGGSNAVVLLYNLAGAACTGAIIGPRAVLTAKHCIQGRGAGPAAASQFRVYVGNSIRSFTEEYQVSEVMAAPGCWDLCGDSSDVAVVVLATPTSVTPLEVSFDSPGSLVGQQITAIGFGETPSGRSGTKYYTEKRVTRVRGGLVFVEPTVCSGDSGGPLIGPDGRIYGVASFIYSPDGASPQCGTAPGAYNGVAEWQSFIEDALERSGSCVPDSEVCNGIDDNCDATIDEGCTALGEPCVANDECVGGLCADSPAGRICSQTCDPLRPDLGCPSSFYCARSMGCDGFCIPTGTVPADPKGFGETCTTDIECGSRFCTDPGDGVRRCMRPCRGDEGTCLDDEVCVAPLGSCGGCLDARLVAPPRGFGEPCTADGDCHSGQCLDVLGRQYCSRACTSSSECPASAHCREGSCVRGPLGALGSNCVTNEDCGGGATLCAGEGTRKWCTQQCTTECPEGFVCENAGAVNVCAPALKLVGESCATSADCLTGLCAGVGSSMVCTRFCGPESLCPSGLVCAPTGDGETAVCVSAQAPPPPPDDGCSASSSAGPGAIALVAVVLGLALRRRRRA